MEERDGGFFVGQQSVNREWGKMGKSLKNAVSPDELYDEYGADTVRLYEMSMGPSTRRDRGRRAPSWACTASCSGCGAT